MGGEERVERQHASGRLTVRERIERLFDAGTFHETGALAGRATYDDERRADGLPAHQHDRRPGPHRRPARGRCRATTSRSAAARPTPPSGRRRSTRSGSRTTCASRSSGSSTARAAAGRSSRSSRWASPTCRRCRASTSSWRTCRACRWWPAALGPVAGLGAARVVCSHFSVIVRGTRPAVRRGAAGRGDGRHGRDARQGAARRRPPAGARRRRRQRRRRRGRRARPAQALPLLPARQRLGGAAGDRRDRPRRPARAGAALDRPARPAPALQDAPGARGGARPRLGVRARRRLRPPHDHLPRPARRATGRRARLGPRALRRRASPPTPPRRPHASSTCATSSACRSPTSSTCPAS